MVGAPCIVYRETDNECIMVNFRTWSVPLHYFPPSTIIPEVRISANRCAAPRLASSSDFIAYRPTPALCNNSSSFSFILQESFILSGISYYKV